MGLSEYSRVKAQFKFSMEEGFLFISKICYVLEKTCRAKV